VALAQFIQQTLMAAVQITYDPDMPPGIPIDTLIHNSPLFLV
jgi:hypothetical protein